ncbi:MAG: BlaI/MecI/CopY family transcriptional regulator [Lactobacillaceae bacterium]
MIKRLTNGEAMIMNVLWSNKKPLSAREIQKKLPKISRGVVAQFLKSLIKKQFINIATTEVINKSLTRFYQPLITEIDYFKATVPQSTLQKLTATFIDKIKIRAKKNES